MDLSSHGGGEMPMPINSKYVGHNHSIKPSSNGPSPTQPPTSEPHQSLSYNLSTMNIKKGGGGGVVVKYRECLKNHAATIGGNATDGCGEFMPSGDEGTMEALKCSACNCHRNFHRKEVEGETYDLPPFHHLHHHQFMKHSRNKVVGQKGVLVSSHSDTTFGGYNPILPLPSPHHMIMPIGAMQTSESDEIEGIAGGGGGGIMSRPPTTKKRFRTKFTPDQKEKMLSFAERVGWRLQRQEEGEVQRFCQEIGVKRRVLKVWMHNNKHNLARRSTISITDAATTTDNSTMSNINPIQMQVQGPHISMQTDM